MTLSFHYGSRALAVTLLTSVAVVTGGCSSDGTDSPSQAAGSGGAPAATGGGGGSGAATAGSSSTSGAGGATGGAATAGSGGASAGAGGTAGGSTGGGGSGAEAGAGAGAGGGGGGGSGTYVACPADKTFCSGFEEAAQPAGSTYLFNAAPGEWTRDFEVDTTVFRHGKSSLKVKGAGGTGALQMLAVPTPTTGPFWVRFYLRQDEMDIGGVKHNVYAGAADSATTNSTVMVEVAEDVGLAFNSHDKVAWPKDHGRILGKETPYTLAKGMWHCIEVQFDGQARTQKLYVGGVETINATEFPPDGAVSFTHFKFGMNALNGPQRVVWYDDVAVGPTRPGCAP